MKSFKQYLLENPFAPNGIYSPFKGFPEWANLNIKNTKAMRKLRVRTDPRFPPDSNFADEEDNVPQGIQGYFGIKKSPITDDTEHNGEATTFHHIGPVSNKGEDSTTNPTFLHIKSKRVENENISGFKLPVVGLSVVISRINHQGVADEEIHHMFIHDADYDEPDDDDNFSMKKIDPGDLINGGYGGAHWVEEPDNTGPSFVHKGLSDAFAIHPKDAENLLKQHLDFELPHRDTPGGPEVTIPIGAFHGQPDYM